MTLGDGKTIAFVTDLEKAVLREGSSFKRLKKGRLSVAEVEAISKVGRNSCADKRAQGLNLPMTTTVNAEDDVWVGEAGDSHPLRRRVGSAGGT